MSAKDALPCRTTSAVLLPPMVDGGSWGSRKKGEPTSRMDAGSKSGSNCRSGLMSKGAERNPTASPDGIRPGAMRLPWVLLCGGTGSDGWPENRSPRMELMSSSVSDMLCVY